MLVIRYFISILLLFFIQNTQAQNNEFDFESKTLDEYKIKEAKLGSKFFEIDSINLDTEYFSKKIRFNEYKQIKFQRINDSFLSKSIACYLSSKKDGKIDGIFYFWDVTNVGATLEQMSQEAKREKEYINKYKDLITNLIKQFGEPIQNKFNENEAVILGNCKWDTEKSIIELFIRFEKLKPSNIGHFSINHINMKIFFKNF